MTNKERVKKALAAVAEAEGKVEYYLRSNDSGTEIFENITVDDIINLPPSENDSYAEKVESIIDMVCGKLGIEEEFDVETLEEFVNDLEKSYTSRKEDECSHCGGRGKEWVDGHYEDCVCTF